MKMLIFLAMLCSFGVASAASKDCKTLLKVGAVTAGQSFFVEIGSGLEMQLLPLDDDWGWTLKAGPSGSDEDWTFPVNFPLRTGESQLLGTGYGETVEERLRPPSGADVRFLLSHADYLRYSTLAYATLESSREEAAGEYLQAMRGAALGEITLQVTSHDKGSSPETVKGMKFKVSIVVPGSFLTTNDHWRKVACHSDSATPYALR